MRIARPHRARPPDALRDARHAARAALMLLALCAPPAAPVAGAEEFLDPLDAPAERSALAARRLLNAVAMAGSRVVAVGQRGHVVFSDDRGRTWTQAEVPVSVDLTSVHFPSPRRGWAVGHGGIVLATRDGGQTWRKQLDGRLIGPLLRASYAREDIERWPGLREQLEILAAPGSDDSFLDVWFADERTGFAVGAFNLVLRTDDGGETWSPWLHRMQNERGLHVYAVRGVAGDVYAVGERGLVRKLDRERRRFVAVSVPYGGSLFGIVADGGDVVAFGLRGTVLRSADGGATWRGERTGVEEAVTGGTAVPGGRVALVTAAGSILLSAEGGGPLGLVRPRRPVPTSSVIAAGPRVLLLVGAGGAQLEDLP